MSIPHISAVFYVIVVAQGAGAAYFRIGLAAGEVFCKDKEHSDTLFLRGSLQLRRYLLVKAHGQHLIYARKDKTPKGIEGTCAQVYILLGIEPCHVIQQLFYRITVLPIHLHKSIENKRD
ncbi:MAG: hypothetical protein FJ241_04160 [Nitrospira sp.]|nr:hypothetical protein [Nitrospira sp.]